MTAAQAQRNKFEEAAMSKPSDDSPAAPQAEGSEKAEQILETIDLLLDLIDEENEALDAHQDQVVIALQDRKDRLTRLYEGHMRAVAQNPTLLNGITEEQRQDLRDAAAELRDAAEDNRRLLQAEMEASNRLLRAIVSAVRGKHQETAVYARSGDMDDGIKSSVDNAMTLNEET